MRKLLSSLACLAVFMLAWAGMAEAAAPRVLVLPFAVNAPAASAQLADDLPALVRQSLDSHGFTAIPTSASRKSRAESTASARSRARSAKADYAVYGSLNQLGESFSIDMQLVNAKAGGAEAFHMEGANLLELQPVVNSLVGRMVGSVAASDSDAAEAAKESVRAGGIADIQVKGLKFLDPHRVLMRLNLKKGDPVDEDAIDDELRNVWNLGYFNDVNAELETGAAGPVLIFNVVEKPRIEEVRVEGSEAVRLSDINEAMSTHTGSVLNEKVLAEDLQKVTDLYHKEGFYLAEVTYDVQSRADGSAAVLVLKVKEGSKLYIKEVAIEGLQQIDPDDVKDYMSLRERGMFSWFTGSGVLKDESLERDTQTIKAYFMKHGYVDGKVAAPEVIYEDDGIRVIFRVREGMRYKVGDVILRGDLIDTEARILEAIKMDEHQAAGDYFDVEVLQKDVKALTEFYADYGFAFADVDMAPRPRPEDGVVDGVYTVKPGEKQYIRRVEVEGNNRTRDNVILRELRLADGQQFSGAKMRRSAQRLEKTRYFKEVNPSIVPTGNPGEVDLKFGVKEDNTGMLSIGFGYSTYDKFGVMASVTENNLFGRGYTLGLTGYTSASEQYLEASFVNPRVFDTYWGFSLNPYGIEEEWTYFDKRSVGVRATLFHPIGEYTRASIGYRFERYNLYNMSSDASRIIREYKGKHWSSTVTGSIVRDTTNKAYFATSGTKVSLSMEYGGPWTFGDDSFFKPIFEAGFYYGLNDTNILHVRGRVGGVFKTDGDKMVPVFERFWIGGMNSIRGYDHDDISPRDTQTNETIGSDRMGYVNLEYIWVVKPEIGLALVPFYDVGFNTDSDQHSEMTEKVFASTGLEVRWRSPMGDLRFAYGYPLSKFSNGEKPSSGRFEFSMGQPF
ncbi:outer membrane protein assembly factor BamA [Mailhella sp.]|uniref:outer membrane protein assembly factor BamA n=1 Tax=Mailhella sp. TaxID=1981029 RepID=UPI004063DDCF